MLQIDINMVIPDLRSHACKEPVPSLKDLRNWAKILVLKSKPHKEAADVPEIDD